MIPPAAAVLLGGEGGEGTGELIGAGGWLAVAADAFEAGDDVLYVHALYKASDALQVAVAAAGEAYVLEFAVFYVEVDQA